MVYSHALRVALFATHRAGKNPGANCRCAVGVFATHTGC
ncbi:hypothetical protein BER2_1036 [plant metagenome]|uniref:Uncharacterized protein n=1 Tax=plant metagenome TaxID=1297885 RepID=A0A484R1C7_9ZZZZ